MDCQPLLWLDTSTLGWWEEEGEGEGRSNLGEALALTAITHELLGLGVEQSMVGVISPYWAQVKRTLLYRHYIIPNNGILKSNSSIFPQSEGYITQYTP